MPVLLRRGLVAALMTAVVGATTPALSSPALASSSGCSGSECIVVAGTGLHVDQVTAKYRNDSLTKKICGKQLLSRHLPGHAEVLIGDSPSFCVTGDVEATVVWHLDRNFANGTILCVYFTGDPRKPCETVHS